MKEYKFYLFKNEYLFSLKNFVLKSAIDLNKKYSIN